MRITARAAAIHSGRFIIHRETFSPGATPRATRPRATASMFRASSANVQRRSRRPGPGALRRGRGAHPRASRSCASGTSERTCVTSTPSVGAVTRLTRLYQDEALVAPGGNLVASLAVLRGTAGIGHEAALLAAGDVAVDARHPGVYLQEQKARGAFVHMLGPGVLGGRARLDASVALLPHVAQQVGDPVDVLLDAARDVAEGGGIVRPHQRQHVGEAGDLQAEIGARTIGPLVLEAQPAAPADVDAVEGASDGIEAGGVDDHVELVL